MCTVLTFFSKKVTTEGISGISELLQCSQKYFMVEHMITKSNTNNLPGPNMCGACMVTCYWGGCL